MERKMSWMMTVQCWSNGQNDLETIGCLADHDDRYVAFTPSDLDLCMYH